MKRSTMRPAALALAGILSMGLAACESDAGVDTELNDDAGTTENGTDLGTDDGTDLGTDEGTEVEETPAG